MFLVFSCYHSDLSVTHIMKRHVLGYGNKRVNNEAKLYYSNWVKKEKNVRGPDSQTVFSKGAWLTMKYT